MKTLELDLKKKVLIVDLPIDAKNVYMSGNSIIYNTDKSCIVKPINIAYVFLCKGSELTEEIASELVDEGSYFKTFKNYITNDNHKRNQLKFAKESFISAVESKGFNWLENPLGEDYRKIDKIFDLAGKEIIGSRLSKWQEAEEKNFKNPLIFVKK